GRCQRYLARIARDYDFGPRHHLLHAIALAQEGILAGAREVLTGADLGTCHEAIDWFMGNPSLRPWAMEWLRRIFAYQSPGAAGRHAKRAPVRARRPAAPEKPSVAPAAEAAPPALAVPELPRYEPAIPVRIELLNADAILVDSPAEDAG